MAAPDIERVHLTFEKDPVMEADGVTEKWPLYRDTLIFDSIQGYRDLTNQQINDMKQARYQAWKQSVQDARDRPPPTEAELSRAERQLRRQLQREAMEAAIQIINDADAADV